MTQISEKLGLGQSTTNQHIKELLRIVCSCNNTVIAYAIRINKYE